MVHHLWCWWRRAESQGRERTFPHYSKSRKPSYRSVLPRRHAAQATSKAKVTIQYTITISHIITVFHNSTRFGNPNGKGLKIRMLTWFKRCNNECFGDVRTISFVLKQKSKRSERQLKPRMVDWDLGGKGLQSTACHPWNGCRAGGLLLHPSFKAQEANSRKISYPQQVSGNSALCLSTQRTI